MTEIVVNRNPFGTEQNEVTCQLFDAIRCQDVDAIARIFTVQDAKTVDLNSRDQNGHTCLGIAAEDGFLPVVELLIKNGADTNKSDFFGMTPLQSATEYGHVDVVRVLLSSGADVNFIEDRLSALHVAACKGQEEIVKMLINKKCNVNILTRKGVSALHCAVTNGHLGVMRLLLGSGAGPNVRGQAYQRTPVFLAAEAGNASMISLLLQFGAKLNLTDQYGMTPLNVACNRRASTAAELLLEAGANVNIADAKGNLPLHYVARSGNVKLARLLIDAGSKIDVLNTNAESPLHLAVRMQHFDIVQLLVDYGCQTDIHNPSTGITPLHVAITIYSDAEEFERILRCLVDGGCQIDSRASEQASETALYRALDLDKADLATILLQYGADVDIECPHGVTILNKACQRGMFDFVRLLTASSWLWRTENWLISGCLMTGFRRRNLGRFHDDDDIFDENEVPLVLWNRLPLYRFLRESMAQPLSLQRCCRLVIRRRLVVGGQLFAKVDSLNYPGALKDFIKLKSADCC